MSDPSVVGKGDIEAPSNNTEKEAEEIQLCTSLHSRGLNPMYSRVDVIVCHLTVSKAFLKSILRQHLLGLMILPKSWTISSTSKVLSKIFLPVMKDV